jgi:hypothetical protein
MSDYLAFNKINHHLRYFFGLRHAPHGLPCDKGRLGFFKITLGPHPVIKRRRFHGSRANGIAAYALGYKVSRQGFGKPDNGGLVAP